MGDVFRTLADPTRRAILDELTERDGQTLFETVVSPEDPEGTELSLEPDEHPAARPFMIQIAAENG